MGSVKVSLRKISMTSVISSLYGTIMPMYDCDRSLFNASVTSKLNFHSSLPPVAAALAMPTCCYW